jgi:hypothetical protein
MICSKCGIDKPEEEFYLRKDIKNPKRSIRRSHCKECHAKYREQYNSSHKEEKRFWVSKNKEKVAGYFLKRKFGISIEEYKEMFYAQNGVCAICGKPESSKDKNGNIRNLCVDHDHYTGHVRGLLCSNCNKGLGCLQDNPTLLFFAVLYLIEHHLFEEKE